PVGTTAAEIVALHEIDALCFVPPHLVTRLQRNQLARIERQKPIGQVEFLGVKAQPESGNIAVKVRFPNQELGLRANTVVRVQVRTESRKDCLALPVTALLEDQDPPSVIVVTPENRDRILKATIGLRDRDRRLVELRGLHDPETNQAVAVRGDMLF